MAMFYRLKVKTRAYKQYIERYVDSPIRHNNNVTILTNGDQIFASMLESIEHSKSTILFLTYVYWRGDIAKQFARALAEKARGGVKVHVLIDAFGSSKMDTQCIKEMRDAGVEFLWFRPVKWYTLHKLNNRTHRKILVIDNQIGFLGGVGIAEEWTGSAQDPSHWRDTHFKVTGPMVVDLIDSFNDNWSEAGGDAFDNGYDKSNADGGMTVQVTSSKATDGATHANKLFMSLIRSAQVNINITTAYFAPGAHLCNALLAARAMGVRITILTNGPHTNQALARKAGHGHYRQLLAAGIEIYEYQQTLLHAKVVTIDGSWASVGSINFDDRSFVLNDEINMSLTDQAMLGELDEQFVKDLAVSKQMLLYKWIKRPMTARLTEIISSFLRRQL